MTTNIITEFYEDCELFVTGGSGVVGKTLIEKLLRSCNVRRIYILLRPKKNLSIEERLQKIINAKLFRRLHEEKPNELQKLVAIPGDVLLPKLGISAEGEQLLQHVSIFFHCAATVRFDEPLRVALNLNVRGTLEAIKLAESLKQLKLFMHVSTYYSNPYLNYVEPKVYDAPMDWRVCLKLLESDISDDLLNAITRKTITGFPNTYTFTKNLAESLVNDHRHRLPVVIFRPSIVIFAVNEPEPGFPPSLMGAMGIFVVVGAGLVKSVKIGRNVHLNLSPQDVCVKTMIYYAFRGWEENQKGQLPEAPVFMCSSSRHMQHSFSEVAKLMEDENQWKLAAFEKCFMIPGCLYTPHDFLYQLVVLTKQVLPAFLGDMLLRLFGQKPVIMGIIRKAYVSLHEMRAFLLNNYNSEGYTEFDEMRIRTKGTEFSIYDDVSNAPNMDGLRLICIKMAYKIREILLKEDPSTIMKQRKIMNIKIFIYNVIRIVLVYYAYCWLYRVVFS